MTWLSNRRNAPKLTNNDGKSKLQFEHLVQKLEMRALFFSYGFWALAQGSAQIII